MPIILIPFSIFIACCIAQPFFLQRLKRTIAARHPEIWHGFYSKTFFSAPNRQIIKFAWRREDLRLNDPKLTKYVKQFRAMLFLTYGSWGAFGLCLFSGFGMKPSSFGGLLDHASTHLSQVPARTIQAANMPLALSLVFAGTVICNLTYLIFAWRLSIRWNTVALGQTVTLGDPLGGLGVIWWSKPSSQDKAFLRLRTVTRALFVLGLVATLSVFALVFSMAR